MHRHFLCLAGIALGAMLVAPAVEAAPKGGGGGGSSRGGSSAGRGSSGSARSSSPSRGSSSGAYHGGNYNHGNYNHGNYNHGNYNHGNYNRGYGYYRYPGFYFGLGGIPYYYGGGYYGRGGYGYNGGGDYYYSEPSNFDPSYYYNNGAGYPPQAPPQDDAVALTDADVLFNVRVPASAKVWFNGDQTSQSGGQREFLSSGLTPGRNYTYEIRARWTQDGQEVDRTQKVKVRGGERRIVDFLATE